MARHGVLSLRTCSRGPLIPGIRLLDLAVWLSGTCWPMFRTVASSKGGRRHGPHQSGESQQQGSCHTLGQLLLNRRGSQGDREAETQEGADPADLTAPGPEVSNLFVGGRSVRCEGAVGTRSEGDTHQPFSKLKNKSSQGLGVSLASSGLSPLLCPLSLMTLSQVTPGSGLFLSAARV